MREPPKLADITITVALRAHNGISIAAPAFLPLGNGSASARIASKRPMVRPTF